MSLPWEDTELRRAALAYVIALYDELTQENGAPLGIQNQAVDLILADPELRRIVGAWAARGASGEATTAPPQRLPEDAAYARVSAFLKGIAQSVFATPAPPSP